MAALKLGVLLTSKRRCVSAVKANYRSQAISYVVNTQMAKELPLDGRNVLQLMHLARDAGPTSSSSVRASSFIAPSR